jgi:TonB family protein
MFWFLVVALSGAPTPPAPPPPAAGHGAIITNPGWAQAPDNSQVEAYYPAAAKLIGREGKVMVRCNVRVDQTLETCRVLSETPKDEGFGAAALGVATTFRIHPKTVDGVPVGGAEVDVPVSFKVDVAPNARETARRCLGWARERVQAAAVPGPAEQRAYLAWWTAYVSGRLGDGDKPSTLTQAMAAAEADVRAKPLSADEVESCQKPLRPKITVRPMVAPAATAPVPLPATPKGGGA